MGKETFLNVAFLTPLHFSQHAQISILLCPPTPTPGHSSLVKEERDSHLWGRQLVR